MAKSLHFSIDIISRGKGQSAVASSAYISGDILHNDYNGETYDYARKERVLYKEILLPNHIPKEFKDRQFLWNSVEMAEKNSNAQLARQFKIALPKELSNEENKKLVEDFIYKNFISEGMAVDYAIHDESRKGNKNVHAHILCIMRPINEKGEFTAKSKKIYLYDDNGNKILNKNGKPKSRKVDLVNWNDKGNAEKWRQSYADICNEYYRRNFIDEEVDERSFKRQGLEKLPTIHLGAKASALERKGIKTDKGNINREIKKYNAMLEYIKKQYDSITGWFGSYIKKLDEAYKEHIEEKRLEAENSSGLFNLFEYIDIYKKIQDEKARHLSGYARTNKGRYDFEKFNNAYNFLANNKLKTIADLQEKIESLRLENRKNNKKVKEVTEQIEKLEKCIAYSETITKHKSIFKEYKNKVFFKEKYYREHKKEIDLHNNLRKQIKNMMGEDVLKPKTWKKELKELQSKLTRLNREKENISNQFTKINHIKYAISTINAEYGIDLSIEIDKAVKRGEKESLIGNLKKFKEISDRDYKYRQGRKTKAISNDMER